MAQMIINIRVNAPEYMVQGIKEALAMWLEERYGNSEVISITEETPKPQQIILNMT